MDIKELRESTGQTQKEFAARFGIPVGTLRRWEYGESTPASYVIKLIASQLPVQKKSLMRIESSNASYYYDKTTGTITDSKGTKIMINEDLDGVDLHNLGFYADSLFESYYDAVEKFDFDCRCDKKEGIRWK